MSAYTVYQLARLANCSIPDSLSPGTDWLERVASAVADFQNCGYDLTDDDVISELADSCIPLHADRLWPVFVDVGAYAEEITDISRRDNFDILGRLALHQIAERLVRALADEA